MKLVTITDDTTDPEVQRIINTRDLQALSGVSLAALMFPNPTADDIKTANNFLDHYRNDEPNQ
jgi:hypothetical protein